jgi:hypothetical protein
VQKKRSKSCCVAENVYKWRFLKGVHPKGVVVPLSVYICMMDGDDDDDNHNEIGGINSKIQYL